MVLRSGGFEGGGLIFGAGIAPLIALRLGRVLRGSALDFFVKTAKEPEKYRLEPHFSKRKFLFITLN